MIIYVKIMTYFVISLFKYMHPHFLIKLLGCHKNLVIFFNVITFYETSSLSHSFVRAEIMSLLLFYSQCLIQCLLVNIDK